MLVVATYRSDELHRRHPLRPLLAELERSPARRAGRARALRPRRARRPARRHPRRGARRGGGRADVRPQRRQPAVHRGAARRRRRRPRRRCRRACARRCCCGSSGCLTESQQLLRLLAVVGRAEPRAARGGRRGRPRRALGRDARGDRGADRGHRRRAGASPSATRSCARCSTTICCPGERAELHLTLAHALERLPRRADEAWIATGIAHHYYAAGDQPARAEGRGRCGRGGRAAPARLRRGGGAARPRARALAARSPTPRS